MPIKKKKQFGEDLEAEINKRHIIDQIEITFKDGAVETYDVGRTMCKVVFQMDRNSMIIGSNKFDILELPRILRERIERSHQMIL